jgi:hypothetical protein
MSLSLQNPGRPAVALVEPEVVLRAALKSPTHSDENRRLAKDIVWSWVGAKWPRLMPPRSQLENGQFQCVLPGRKLTVATSTDGSAWSLEVSYSEREGGCTWTTCAVVADIGDADMVAVQTSCTLSEGQRRIAPPRVLGRWVDRLQLDDAGVAVRGEPRIVEDDLQLAALCDHLLAADRRLPVILLGNKLNSRYYGVDPRGLAEAVCGLAHVACLTPEAIALFSERFGRRLAPAAASVRIYMPGFGASAEPREHPLMRPAHAAPPGQAPDPAAFRRFVCRRICELSVQATRDTLTAPFQGSLRVGPR